VLTTKKTLAKWRAERVTAKRARARRGTMPNAATKTKTMITKEGKSYGSPSHRLAATTALTMAMIKYK
jgi:hypothetical protein